MTTFDYKKLRANTDSTVDVVGYATVDDEYSALAGQTVRHYLDTYDTVEEAQAAHPEATSWFHPLLEPVPNFNHLRDDEEFS